MAVRGNVDRERLHAGTPAAARAAWALVLAAAFVLLLPLPAAAQTASGDSPVFANDTAKTDAVRAVEAGGALADTTGRTTSGARRDSLEARLARRGPYVGVTAGAAFGQHSARERMAADFTARATEAGERILQRQDPVHVLFPAGLVAGFPVARHFDVLLRTEHFRYRVTGLAQQDNEPATEYSYTTQAHLAGLGARWLVPVSFLTVSGQPGLYLAYTHLWQVGPSGMRSGSGSLRAREAAAGAGFELAAGFQQDFSARFALTGALALSRLAFRSDGDWSNVAPTSAPEPAEWRLTSARFLLQGIYQFGRPGRADR